MIKKIFICVLILLFTTTSSAGVITYGVKKTFQVSGLTIAISAISINIILKAIESGENFEEPIKILNAASKVKTTRIFFETMFSYIILKYQYGSRPDIAQSAMTIISSSKLYTNAYEKRFEIDKVKLNNYVLEFATVAEELNKKYRCINKKDIYSDTLYLGPEKGGSGGETVKAWDYGSYKFLSSIELEFDDLEHDHVPALKSVYTYLEKRDNLGYYLERKKDKAKTQHPDGLLYGKRVELNTSAIEITKELHSKGRTFRGRMNALIESSPTKTMKKLFEVDAQNLKLATVLDFGFYAVDQKGISKKMWEAFNSTFERNKKLCLYEK